MQIDPKSWSYLSMGFVTRSVFSGPSSKKEEKMVIAALESKWERWDLDCL
jgi:hypothetical protein